MAKILIVEDQKNLRDALEKHINAQGDMEVVGTADDAALVPGLCRQLCPDLVLMDVVTKNASSGISYAEQIRKKFPDIKIVLMTSFQAITFAEEARKVGAHSFVGKDAGSEHLLHVIRSTLKGYSIYSGNTKHQHLTNRFSKEEIAVIGMVCRGMTRGEMAKELAVQEVMIMQHIASILDKTGFTSISEFALYAISEGLIVPELG